MTALFVDGEPATADDLAHQALVNYGAYTSFRVEGGRVRGLDRHLARLEASAVELFGEAVGEARLRELMRRALAGRDEAWLRVSLFSPEIWPRDPTRIGPPKVMVGVFDPPPPLRGPLRLQLQIHDREAAHLKHAATFGLMRARRTARAAGFDDALFVGADGRVSEGTLWNIGFVRGDQVTWPEAPMLAGVTQGLLDEGLAAAGLDGRTEPVRADGLDRFEAAFICNSATPACPVAAVGEREFATPVGLIERLAGVWAAAAAQPI